MLLRYFQIYFIFVNSLIIQVTRGVSKENTTTEEELFRPIEPLGKCKEDRCRCTDFPKWEGIKCKDDYGFYYPTLLFQKIQYLSGRMFEGYRFRMFNLTALDNYNVTFAGNALEGILKLEQFEAKRSSIKVTCLLILDVLETFLLLQIFDI